MELVLEGSKTGEVGAAPSKPREETTGLHVGRVDDGVVAANIRHEAKEMEVEGLDGFVVSLIVEGICEVLSLLLGDLGSGTEWIVVDLSTVTEGVDISSTLTHDAQVAIHTDAVTVVLREERGLSDKRTRSNSSAPHQETIVQDLTRFEDDGLVCDRGDLRAGSDMDAFLLEGDNGLVDEMAIKGCQDRILRLEQCDRHEVSGSMREGTTKILPEKVTELSSKLDTSGSSTDDDKVEQTAFLLIGGRGQTGNLKALDDARSDLPGVLKFLEEVGVFLDTLDAKGVVFCTNSNDELVVRDREGLLAEFISAIDDFGGGIKLGGSAVKVGGGAELWGLADGLDNAAKVERSSARGRQEGREEKVIARGNDRHVVLGLVDRLDHTNSCPSSAEHDKLLSGLKLVLCLLV